jgi:hypothetical protein
MSGQNLNKMKTTIEIKIECKGEAVGTLGWFNSIMQKSELVIKNTKKGTPAMFLKTPTKDGTFAYQFICEKAVTTEDNSGYIETNDGFVKIYAEQTNGYLDCFSNYPLTPACKIKVKEMIDLALEKFTEWWENDK